MSQHLTDLFERAVSTAPPEPHPAHDITRLAVRRQQRRTTSIAAAASVAVIVAGVVGYGATRDQGSTPQPVGPPGDLRHQSVADAVPAASTSGFDTLDYGVPSVADHLAGLQPIGQYADVDPQGRLVAMELTESGGSTPRLAARYQIVDGPGKPPSDVQDPPPVPGGGGVWQPSFTPGGGGLAWQQQANALTLDYLLTDAGGGRQIRVRNDLSQLPVQGGDAERVRHIWDDAGRVWFSAVTRENAPTAPTPQERVSLFSVDPTNPSVVRPEKPTDAVDIELAGDVAVWIQGTTVRALDLRTGAEHTVPVPRDSGCELPPASMYFGGNFPGLLTTNGHLVSMVELCAGSQHVVVFDLDGALVTDVASSAPGYIQQVAMSGGLLTFEGDGSDGKWTPYAVDLATRHLVSLGPSTTRSVVAPAHSTGRYLLWYDADGGHVGRWAG